MMRHFSRGLRLGVLLGSAAVLSPLAGLAQTPPPAAPPKAAPPAAAPPVASPPAKAADDKGGSERETADRKAMASDKAFFDARLAGLRAGLQLTPAQDPLWTPVEAAIRDLAKLRLERRHARDDEAMDPLHRLTRMSERLIQGGKAMKALTDATSPLVASLDQDQKDRLPKLLGSMRPGRILRKAFNVADEPRGNEDGDGRRSGMSRRGDDRPDHAMRERHRGGEDEGDGETFRGGHRHHDWGRDFGSRDRDHDEGRSRRSNEGHDADSPRYGHRDFDRDHAPDDEPRRHGDRDERT